MKVKVLTFPLLQFGLPRAVDEVEVGLGNLLLHVFPHQVEKMKLH